MKNAFIFVAVSLFVFNGEISAQQKYGHINSTEVVQSMPEFKQMNVAVEKRKKEAQIRVQQMYDSYQQKVKEVNQFGASMMEAVLEERKKELDSLQRGIATYEQTEGTEIQNYQEKLLKPLYDKYHKIVASVAKENGYTYVFDVATGGVAYYPETTGNVTELVKQKLGVN
jgi:outer membrane protein